MRILKKLVRKLYHLIWFLSIFFIVSPLVYATDGVINGSIYSSDISASAQAQWYDVNHSEISTSLINNPYFSPYFQSGARYNSYLSFNVYTNLQTNVLYSLTVYLNDNTNTNLIGWNNAVSTGTFNGGANSNNSSSTCRADIYSFVDSYNIKYKININEDGTNDASTGAYYITFKPTCRGNYLNIPVAFTNPGAYMYFYGYHLEVLGLTDGLTSNDIRSVINSSGLATANSVSQVQSSVNQVQQELSDLEESERQNAEDIMDNQNSNTDKEIESQKVCNYIDNSSIKDDNKYLTTTGSITNYNGVGITDYIKLSTSSILTLQTPIPSNSPTALCFYNVNKTLISCLSEQGISSGSTITIPNNTSFVRFSIFKSSNFPTFNICTNGNQALNDSINGLNDNITDSNVDSSDNTINNLKNRIPTNSVISDLLLLPVRFLQNFVNALGSSCSQFNLGSLYGTNLYMSCINIENYLGSAIWTTIDLIISGLFVYSLRKKFIQIYQNLTNLKNGGNEVD